MKKISLILLAGAVILNSGCFNRVGRLTMISTRNVDGDMSQYVLLVKNVKAKGKSKTGDALEVAIDNAVKKIAAGEFMKNVIIYSSSKGNKIKVEGDVWGYKSDINKSITTTVNANIEFKRGDRVTFSKGNKIYEATILGLSSEFAVVEYTGFRGRLYKAEIKYEALTKLGD